MALFSCRECQALLFDMQNYFTVNDDGGVGIFISIINVRTDGQTDIHFFGISSLYGFQWYIILRCYLIKYRPSAKQ